jgi:hypothetical protein
MFLILYIKFKPKPEWVLMVSKKELLLYPHDLI